MSTSYDKMLEQLESELAGIEIEYSKLNKKRTLLQDAVAKVKDLKSLANGSMVGKEPLYAISPHAFDNLTIVNAAIKYLKLMGKPQRNRTLVDDLIRGGVPTKAGNPSMTIRSVLKREMDNKGTFTWENGEWGLSEWKTQAGLVTTITADGRVL